MSKTILQTVGPSALDTLSLLFVACTAYSQNIIFDTLPVNQTVVEGGDATFSCSGTVNGTAQPTRYRIRSGATVLQTVGANISDLVTVNGIDAALVFGDFNLQLLLSRVMREADGYTVSCAIRVGAVFPDAMNVPLAFVTVVCKSFVVHSIPDYIVDYSLTSQQMLKMHVVLLVTY